MKSLEVALRVGSSWVSAEPSGMTLVDSTPDSLSLLRFRSRRLLPNTSCFASATLVRKRLLLRFSPLDGSAEPVSLPVLDVNVRIAAICTLLSPVPVTTYGKLEPNFRRHYSQKVAKPL